MSVLQSILAVVKSPTLPQKPSEFDLRFFRKIHYADTYNGLGTCAYGVEYTAILYGSKIVSEFAIYREPSNMKHNQGLPSSKLLCAMYEIAQRYLQIQKICRAKYFKYDPVNGHEGLEGKNWDYVALTQEQLAVLKLHPQYKETVKTFGIRLVKRGDDYFQVVCTKKRPPG